MAANTRWDWHFRIRGVEREFVVARAAMTFYGESIDRDARLPPGVNGGNVRDTSRNLEGTYVVRLFAMFESGLRSYWRVARSREELLATRVLIERIGGKHNIPLADRALVHEVREYRNDLTHRRDRSPKPVGISEALTRLQRYFARLPESW